MVGVWNTYTPTVTGASGSPTATGRYVRIGCRTIVFEAAATMAGSAIWGATAKVSLPVTPASTHNQHDVQVTLHDLGFGYFPGGL